MHLRNFLTIFSEKGYGDCQLLSVTREKGVILRDKDNKEENHNFVPDDLSGYKHVHVGDFVINKMKSWQGSYGVSDYDGIVSPAYFTCKLKGVDPLFFSKAIRSKAYIGFFMQYSKGIRVDQWDLDPNSMKDIPFVLPTLEEQKKIATYLDTVTSKLDAAIAQQQKMIDLLNERKQIIINNAVTKGLNPNVKMKDSGVDWIGEIPEGWSIIPIKHIIKFINGYAFNSNDFKSDGDVPVIRISNILDGQVCLDDIAYVSYKKELEPYVTHKGDLLIAMSGATTGKVGFDLEGGKYINQRVGAIRSEYQQFVFYWLNSTFFREYVLLSALGSAQPNISSKEILNFQICLPMKEEIEEISCYIKRELNKIAPAVSNAKKQISLLQERKQIIINDVVTGKVKVI